MKDMENKLFIGVMSGTSLDGIDCVLVCFDKSEIEIIDKKFIPYEEKLRNELIDLTQNDRFFLSHLVWLSNEVGAAYGNAINEIIVENQIGKKKIEAVGISGQTVLHQPTSDRPYTFQIGNISKVHALTSLNLIYDFRVTDMNNGGHGAPLLPAFFDHIKSKNFIYLNIGGIANISFKLDKNYIGYDCGPGNTLIDLCAQKFLNLPFDPDGAHAKQGEVDKVILDKMLDDAYFKLSSPKSTGTDYFNQNWVSEFFQKEISNLDFLATVTELTAKSIASEINAINLEHEKVIVYGGGSHNTFLINRIMENLKHYDVVSSELIGLDPDYVEAIAFAWLAKERVQNKTIDLTQITGSRSIALLGECYL